MLERENEELMLRGERERKEKLESCLVQLTAARDAALLWFEKVSDL